MVGTLIGIIGSVTGVTGVAPPGPADDLGDLVVFVDGIAWFVSDSGWVIWLTDDQQSYRSTELRLGLLSPH